MILNIIASLLAVYVCGKLWRLGGSEGYSKLWRTLGVPFVISLVQFVFLGSYVCFLYIPLLKFLGLDLVSYGKTAPPHRFFVWLLGEGRHTEVVTRAFCGFCWALPAYLFVSLGASLTVWITYVAFLTIANGLIGGLVKDAVVSENNVGRSVATAVFI